MRNIGPRGIFAALMVVSVFTALFAADDFWQKKDYRQWSKKECDRILSDSPWAQTYDSSKVTMALLNNEAVDATLARPSSTSVVYTVQFRSAMPMRKAVVRQELLRAGIESKPAGQVQQMLAQAQKFLDAPVGDVILVHVIYGSNVQQYDRELANFWQHQTLNGIRNQFFLIGSKGRVSPIDYAVAPGAAREFEVTFPRTLNGEPVVATSDRTLAVEFHGPEMAAAITTPTNSRTDSSAASDPTRVFVPFKVDTMKVGGDLVY